MMSPSQFVPLMSRPFCHGSSAGDKASPGSWVSILGVYIRESLILPHTIHFLARLASLKEFAHGGQKLTVEAEDLDSYVGREDQVDQCRQNGSDAL